MAFLKLWLVALLTGCSMQSPIAMSDSDDAGVILIPGVKTHLVTENVTANVKAQTPLPMIKLPYGTYMATSYDAERDVYEFKNIRFGKAPVGDLRFRAPQLPDPDPSAGVQKQPDVSRCIGYIPRTGMNLAGEYQDYKTFSGPLNWVVPRVGGVLLDGGVEDCLFLDVQVPGKLMREPGSKKVPVVNWIYGGAFYLGSKETGGLYSGAHLIEEAKGDMIWVAANYRLGLYGWLAGPTVEDQATPNAGLHDQRLALQWIQDHIHLFGGDKDRVSAWGESAGASSILHHLVAYGGTQDPLFKRAVLLSPAFQPLGDRRPSGMEEKMTKRLLSLAKCTDIACLRRVPNTQLIKMNWQLQDEAPRGAFALGPAVDGTWSKRYPAIELKEGNYWKGLESIMLSHTTHESTVFVDGTIQTDAEFDKFLVDLFADLAIDLDFAKNINEQYPRNAYKTQTQRVMAFIRDSAFNCNVRWLTEAYLPRSFNMLWGEWPGWHGADLLSVFYRADIRIGSYSVSLTPAMSAMSKAYQSYLVSHAISGDPNKLVLSIAGGKGVATPAWPNPPRFEGQNIANIMVAGNNSFRLGEDFDLPKAKCDFVQDFQARANKIIEGSSRPPVGQQKPPAQKRGLSWVS